MARRPGDRRTSEAGPAGPARPRLTAYLVLLYAMWFVLVADPQWWIASFGPKVALRVPTVLFALLLAVTLAQAPRRLFPPLLAFLAYMVLLLPFSYNRAVGLDITKTVFAFYVIALATLTGVRTARAAVPIILWALLLQYAWWVVLGVRNGRVPWHFAYNNYDGYGPLMVIGLATTFHVALAARERRLRALAFAVAAGCVLGLVSSYARGAVVSAVAVSAWVWWRSKRKLRTALIAVGAASITLVATTLVFTNVQRGDANSNFWVEMSTIFDPKDDGTRQDREIIWAIARRIYVQHPFFGVGPHNFGPYAAQNFPAGTLGGAYYNENPGRLYNKALHNTYYQLLCEFGTVGTAIFVWMLWDFWKRNRALRKPERVQAWAQRSGGQLDLKNLSLGLEAGMLGWMTTAYFYNQIFDVHWFYTLLTINALLFYLSRPTLAKAAGRSPS